MKWIWDSCSVNKWQFTENSFGNIPKSQTTAQNFQLYKDFFAGSKELYLNICRLIWFVYICCDHFISEITYKNIIDRNQYSTVHSVNELVYVWNTVVKVLSGHAYPNTNRPQTHSWPWTCSKPHYRPEYLSDYPRICSNKRPFLFVPNYN